MILTREQRTILREGISKAYPNEDGLRIILSEQMDVQLAEIVSGGAYMTKIFELIEHFAVEGMIEDFIRVVVADKPRSPYLEAIKKEFAGILGEDKDSPKDTTYGDPEKENMARSINRGQLMTNLNQLVPQQFNHLLFQINPPPGIIPAYSASQADRVYSLLTWAESPSGIGLNRVQAALDTIINSSISIHSKEENFKENSQVISNEQVPIMNILHLSDLHFGTPEQAQIWSNQLVQDLRNELNVASLDALILSGDIANKSTESEYEAARQFLDSFREDFPLKSEQIIIVPGNHDLNWQKSEDAYTPVRRRNYSGPTIIVNGETRPDPNYAIDKGGDYVEQQDEGKYKERFFYFSQFYQSIKGAPYPIDNEKQYTIDHFPDGNLLILGLNSAWQLDHYDKDRASINMKALTNALTEIRRKPEYKNFLKIAVWHHPLNSAGNDRITDQGFMEQLAVAGFRFFLHGHVHEAQTSLYRYDMSTDGRKLDRICAGTFGAPTKELVPGYPWQYNLLKFEADQLIVETRRREKENGAWKPDARWLQGAGQDPLPRYTIALEPIKK